MPTALLSVTDKTGIIEFARVLTSLGFDLLSTGGTARALREAGLVVADVADRTGFPEMLDGRVKTLHPLIHAGLLADLRRPEHVHALDSLGVGPISLLCVNLYRFQDAVTREHSLADAIESIDIGGPVLIRAAAKNATSVTVVVDPSDYSRVLQLLRSGISEVDRLQLMAKAFRHTASYDAMIARYLTARFEVDLLQDSLTMSWSRAQVLRYGENPHQRAALFADPLEPGGIAAAEQLWGKEISYNNVLDADAAWELVCDLSPSSCAIIKHGNPCGAAWERSLAQSYCSAREADPVSAFGGIAAFHGPIDLAAAEAMTSRGNYLEVVIATDFSDDALDVFRNRSGWGQDVRLLRAQPSPQARSLSVRTIRGGALVQDSDEDPGWNPRLVTSIQLGPELDAAARSAWAVVQHVKSNGIVVCNQDRVLGVGAGQMNRVQSVELALRQAGSLAKGAVLASDAFFPFPDSIEAAAQAGIAAIVQPGGSKKDQDVIDAAESAQIAMIFTGIRHFRH